MNEKRIAGYIDEILKGLLLVVAYLASQKLGELQSTVKEMQMSMSKLNEQIAVLIVKQGGQDGRIEDHEGRIRGLEKVKRSQQ